VRTVGAFCAWLEDHGLVGDVGRADAYFLPETDVPVPVTDPYGR
jgi:hypothetical protein